MATKKIDIAKADLATLQTKVREQQEKIATLLASCKHALELRLQYPIPVDDGRGPSRWWLHFECTTCASAYTINHAVPLCPTCETPLVLFEENTSEARGARKDALQKDKHAKKIYVFLCSECSVLQGIPTRIEVPKKKPSPL